MTRNNWTNEKLISRLCSQKSDKSRWDNISVLRKRPSEELFIMCVELTKSKNPKTRTIGIDILAQMGNTPRPFLKQTLKLFFEILNLENDPEVLMSLLYGIGHTNHKLNKAQVEKLCTFSNNDNIWVKKGLVYSLLGIDNPKAIETLIKFSNDKISHIRNWATFGIGTLIERDNKNIKKALWDRINDKHQETKLEAIVGLAKRKDSQINDIIKLELQKGEYGTLIFKAINEIGDKQFLPILKQNLKLAKGDTSTNPEWLIELKECIDNLKKHSENGERTTA
jgi:HEAT repeat protein